MTLHTLSPAVASAVAFSPANALGVGFPPVLADASALIVADGDGVPACAVGKEKQFFVRADVAPSVDNGKPVKPVNDGVRFWAFDRSRGKCFCESVPVVVKASELAFVLDYVLGLYPMIVMHTCKDGNISVPFFVGRWDYDNDLECFEPSVLSAVSPSPIGGGAV